MITGHSREAALAIRWAAIVLAAVSPLALAGCGVDYASSEPATAASDYHVRHPILLANAPTRLDVYPVHGALDDQSIANIRAFAKRYQEVGSGEVAILTPGSQGASARAVDDIRKTLAQSGMTGYVAIGSYNVPDRAKVAPIRIAFMGLKAKVPSACGQWPSDIISGGSLEGWKNEGYANFGCATQSVLAAQVDDPRDLLQARASDPPDVSMRLRAIGKVRSGSDPGTNWKIQNSNIGQVGGN